MDKKYLKEAEELVVKLSLDDKCRLFEGAWRWGIGGIKDNDGGYSLLPTVCADGPCGLRKENLQGQVYPSRLYPCPAAMASTWDIELGEEVGKAMGSDCRKQDVDMLLAPGVNVKRNARCGRCFEYFSEDPLLAGEMGAAFVTGLQTQGVGACLKHYLLNSQETDRFSIDESPDEKTMMDIYFPAFALVVSKADPWAIMASYNRINGVQSCENEKTIGLLRELTGYNGVFISDWGGVEDSYRALMAGLNVQMPGIGGDIAENLAHDTRGKEDFYAKLDESAAYVLATNLRNQEARKIVPVYDETQKAAVALKAAQESIILLKNDGILPLKKEGHYSILGERATDPLTEGNGSSRVVPSPEVLNASLDGNYLTPLKGLTSYLTYAPTYDKLFDQYLAYDKKSTAEVCNKALKVINGTEATVLFIGVSDFYDAEGADKDALSLPAIQLSVFKALKAAKQKVVVVVQSGSAIDLTPFMDADAIVFQYMGGSYTGQAIADVLTGKINPSGRLAETLPVVSENHLLTAPIPRVKDFYEDGEYVGYRYYDSFAKRVCFPFGYGLSYTDFTYSSPSLSSHIMAKTANLRLSFDVTNSGNFDGMETVQIYLRPKQKLKGMPDHWLVKFVKVSLLKGEKKRVYFEFTAKDFASWSVENHAYLPMAGDFIIEIAHDSRDIRLTEDVTVPLDTWTQIIQPVEERKEIAFYSPLIKEKNLPCGLDRRSSVTALLTSRWYFRLAFKFIRKKLVIPHQVPKYATEYKDALRVGESNVTYPLRFMAVTGMPKEMMEGLILMGNHHTFKGLRKVFKAKKKSDQAMEEALKRIEHTKSLEE